jgi:hypothetical protein
MAEARNFRLYFEGNPMAREAIVENNVGEFFYNAIQFLPAAQFFWFDKVKPKDRLKYFNLLGQLYELFITPHAIPIPPYEDCSYLKKFEQLDRFEGGKRRNAALGHIIKIFKIENSNIEALTSNTYDIDDTQEDLVIPSTLLQVISNWYLYSEKNILAIPLSLELNHAVFLGLKKYKDQRLVKFIYIDPHGFAVEPEMEKAQLRLRELLKKSIASRLVATVQEVLMMCPILQLVDQGGNCVQWQKFNFTMFLSNPHLFDDPEELVHQVGLFPAINVHLFNLSVFLRTMPHYGLQTYYEYSMYGDFSDQVSVCWEEDAENRKDEARRFQMPDCYSQKGSECPEPCVFCSGSCNFPTAVKRTGDGECTPLSGKMIAKKMFQIYALIRKITGQDPESMTARDIEKQLDFVEPQTEKEFIKKYNISADELVRRRIMSKNR